VVADCSSFSFLSPGTPDYSSSLSLLSSLISLESQPSFSLDLSFIYLDLFRVSPPGSHSISLDPVKSLVSLDLSLSRGGVWSRREMSSRGHIEHVIYCYKLFTIQTHLQLFCDSVDFY